MEELTFYLCIFCQVTF